MIRSLFTAATGMQAQQINIDVISNNLANANTNGFKRSRADFQDLLYQTMRMAGAANSGGGEVPTGLQVGLGVKPAAVNKVFSQGEFIKTENSLDLVIEGNGFFQLTKPDGTIGYTRGGAFKMSSEGTIVSSDGYPMEPAITIPSDSTSVSVSNDGVISVLQPGSVTPNQVGQIQLARFSNPSGLESLGNNMYAPTAASGEATVGNPNADGIGAINQGYVESSNVNVVEELVSLIVSQRAYELSSKVVQATDDMLQLANNLRR